MLQSVITIIIMITTTTTTTTPRLPCSRLSPPCCCVPRVGGSAAAPTADSLRRGRDLLPREKRGAAPLSPSASSRASCCRADGAARLPACLPAASSPEPAPAKKARGAAGGGTLRRKSLPGGKGGGRGALSSPPGSPKPGASGSCWRVARTIITANSRRLPRTSVGKCERPRVLEPNAANSPLLLRNARAHGRSVFIAAVPCD
jgi:hypothetical protein